MALVLGQGADREAREWQGRTSRRPPSLFETAASRLCTSEHRRRRRDRRRRPADRRAAVPDRAALRPAGRARPGAATTCRTRPAASRWTPPRVQSRVVAPLSQEGAQLLDESSSWANAFGPLTQAWRRASVTQPADRSRYLHGGDAIDPFICRPGRRGRGGDAHRPAADRPRRRRRWPAAAQRDSAMLERGTTMRTLYQHSARRSSITHKYVAAVTARGAEVRTLDEFFNRMIVIDRRVAVIPERTTSSASRSRSASPSIVAYLVDVFERAWERGRPFTNRERTMMADIAAEQRAMTIRMLIEGHSDPVEREAARRQPAHLCRLRRRPEGRSTSPRPASSSATRWAARGSPAPRSTTELNPRRSAKESRAMSGQDRDTALDRG